MTPFWRTEGPNDWVLADPDATLQNRAWVEKEGAEYHLTLWKDGAGWKRRLVVFSTLEEAKAAAEMAVRMGVI